MDRCEVLRVPLASGAARAALGAMAVLFAFVAGCADWSYGRIRLGMSQSECERLFPDGALWRTDLGLCGQPHSIFARRDVLVVLLTRDQRVAGKFEATYFSPGAMLAADRGYRLRAELDPELSGLQATGPIDVLRAVADDLAGYRGAQPVMEAHAWVAAGLVRLVESWTQAGSPLAAQAMLTEVLTRVPAGGETQIQIGARRVYRAEYRQPNTP